MDEAQYIYEEEELEVIAEKILQNHPEIVVIKNGSEGTYYQTEKERGFIPSFDVKNVVDPVGAGDGFDAGFISGLLKNYSLEESVKIGNAVGANVVTTEGDIEGLPEIDDLEQYFSSIDKDIKR